MRARHKKKDKQRGCGVEVAEQLRTTKNVQAVDCRLQPANDAGGIREHGARLAQTASEDESFQGGSKCCLKG
jgi:hypothetical protein